MLSRPSSFQWSSRRSYAATLSRPSQLSEGLFRFIKKNTAIPDFLSRIDAKNPKAQTLLTALQQGDFEAPIFSDPDCDLYLLHLREEKKLSFEAWMTANIYLSALRQYTDKQPLREEDAKAKIQGKVVVNFIVQDQDITHEGHHYIKTVSAAFAGLQYRLNHADLAMAICALPTSEQTMISIEYPRSPHYQHNELLHLLLANMPFVQHILRDTVGIYRIPSVSIIQYMLHKMTLHPVEMLPIFGRIKPETLSRLHSENKHPVSLYATRVKNNLLSAHTFDSVPFLVLLHDVGHVFWGTMLEQREREVLFKQYIPGLEAFKQAAQAGLDESLVVQMTIAIEKAYDFDLTDIRLYAKFKDRFFNYLMMTLGGDFYRYGMKYRGIGCCAEDRLFFLISQKRFDKTLPEIEQQLWTTLSLLIQENVAMTERRDPAIMRALVILAQNASNEKVIEATEKPADIEWHAWLAALEKTDDSKVLWDFATSDNRQRELLALITQNKLTFLHPYLPMTPEKHAQFRDYVQVQVNAATNKSVPTDAPRETLGRMAR